jgi:hypothetical protein
VKDDGLTTAERKRALRMHDLAVSLVQAKGLQFQSGALPMLQYKRGNLTIHYLPKAGHLSVWYRYKVLTINPRQGILRITRYLPGEWEEELEDAADIIERR